MHNWITKIEMAQCYEVERYFRNVYIKRQLDTEINYTMSIPKWTQILSNFRGV